MTLHFDNAVRRTFKLAGLSDYIDAVTGRDEPDYAIPSAVGAGTAALATPYLMRKRLHDNPTVRALQEQIGDRALEFATGSPQAANIRRHIFGGKDVSADMVDAVRESGGRYARPGKAVLHHGYGLPVEGDVNINAGALPGPLSDKANFDAVMRQVAPDALPETYRLDQAMRQYGDYDGLKRHFGDRGYVIKPSTGSLGSIDDFVQETTPDNARSVREALDNPTGFVVQEKIPIKNEYRVHALNTEPFTATYRRMPEGRMRDTWNSVSSAVGAGEGGFAHLPVTGGKRERMHQFVRESLKGLAEEGPVGSTEHLHQALDVAELPDGSFKLIESNPVPGTLMNPVVSRKLRNLATGRRGVPESLAGGVATGVGTGGATMAGQEVYDEI